MNAQIVRLFGLIVVLFMLLLVWTTRWTVIDAKSLQNNPLNDRTLVQELRIKRGRILARDGTVLAHSVRGPGGTWNRAYPTGTLFSQVVGYSLPRTSQVAGLELSRGSELRGIQTGLSSIFGPFSSNRVGDDVYTSLDPKAQALARTLLAGRAGSVVALDPQTGEVEVMYAQPSYDDNHPNAPCGAPGCYLNRSTQAGYPPGSTFKIVTAAAALDTGRYTPNSIINGNSPITVSGVPLQNDGNQSWGPVTLTKALTYSINTVFAQVGQSVGRSTMETYMKRFGFYSKPPLDLPPGELSASGERTPSGRLLLPTNINVDLGRMSIGQDKLAVTPLQMAMVASAVADHGKLMAPHFATRVVNQDGQTVETIKPALYQQVMKPSTAAELTQMMTDVVEEGTGTAANLLGIHVAGKTGTAQVGVVGSNITQPWFIGFAPVENPTVAVAVTVERSQGGFGGTVAAPIAAQIIKTILADGG